MRREQCDLLGKDIQDRRSSQCTGQAGPAESEEQKKASEDLGGGRGAVRGGTDPVGPAAVARAAAP